MGRTQYFFSPSPSSEYVTDHDPYNMKLSLLSIPVVSIVIRLNDRLRSYDCR